MSISITSLVVATEMQFKLACKKKCNVSLREQTTLSKDKVKGFISVVQPKAGEGGSDYKGGEKTMNVSKNFTDISIRHIH